MAVLTCIALYFLHFVSHFCRYIPENFYSDFTISEQTCASSVGTQAATTSIAGSTRIPDYLETVVAAAGKSNTHQPQATPTLLSAQPQALSQSAVLQVIHLRL